MQDELDIRKLCSNDVNAMLEKYGVEAARATIVAEIRAVFERYRIEPDIHHLSLIAHFMTFDGQYRPMNRFGISSSVSPFLKITFDTATNFIVHMASHGEMYFGETTKSISNNPGARAKVSTSTNSSSRIRIPTFGFGYQLKVQIQIPTYGSDSDIISS
ncbi:DNA-directed RNA polymerase III subunit [Nymphaea thermarum]|nr:DNA-directed RNA polymerase III subunit [Nymphaea thermarum]